MDFNQFLSWQPILLIIILIVFGFAIFIIRFRQNSENIQTSIPGDNTLDPNTMSVDSKVDDKDLPGKRKLFIIGLTLTIAVGILIFFLRDKGDSSGNSSSSLLPIWIAVFIPLIASQKKKKNNKKMSDKEKEIRKFLILLILGFAMALGMIIFYFAK